MEYLCDHYERVWWFLLTWHMLYIRIIPANMILPWLRRSMEVHRPYITHHYITIVVLCYYNCVYLYGSNSSCPSSLSELFPSSSPSSLNLILFLPFLDHDRFGDQTQRQSTICNQRHFCFIISSMWETSGCTSTRIYCSFGFSVWINHR